MRGVGELLPLSENNFDLVLILSALDHCFSPERVLTEVKSVLRPGGILLVTLQNYGSWYRRLLKLVAPSYTRSLEKKDHHNWHFIPKTTEDILVKHGFTNITCAEFGYLSVPRLESLESLLFRLPLKLLTQQASLALISRLNSGLGTIGRGYGGGFLIYGHAQK
jgi:SAM-dependent methyltransferase